MDPAPDTGRVTKRFIMCLLGCSFIWWFMKTERDWVWCFFAALQGYEKIPPELATIASAGISSITAITTIGITGIVAIVLFLVTGNVAVLRAFQFASIGQASASVSSAVESRFSRDDQKIEVIRTPKAESFDGDDIP